MDGGDSAGGSIELARLIDEHGEALLADFLRYYNLDLSDVLVPGSGLTSRKALALIRNLPHDSATTAAIQGGDQFRGWDGQMYMLANIVDAIKENTHVFVSANSKRRPQPPKPMPRPTTKTAEPMANSFAAMARAAYMNGSD